MKYVGTGMSFGVHPKEQGRVEYLKCIVETHFILLLVLRLKTDLWGRIKATIFKVIVETEEQVEVSFSRPWDPSHLGKLAPINIDKRFFL